MALGKVIEIRVIGSDYNGNSSSCGDVGSGSSNKNGSCSSGSISKVVAVVVVVVVVVVVIARYTVRRNHCY